MTLSLALRSACLGFATAALSLAAAQAADSLQVVARNPAKDAFTTFPKQIHLAFNGPVKPTSDGLQLMDPDGRRIRLTTPVVSKDGVTVMPELTGGPPVLGPYELSWKADAPSGSEAQGRYTFFVQQP